MSSDLQSLLISGFEAHRDGRLEAAEAAYRAVLAAEPAHAEATHLLGLAAMARGDRTAALTLLRDAAARLPQLAMAQFNLGNALLLDGRKPEAAAAFEAALRADPEHDAGRAALARTLLELGRATLGDGRVEDGLQQLEAAAVHARSAGLLEEISHACHPHDTLLGSRLMLRAWSLAPGETRLYDNAWNMHTFLGRRAATVRAFQSACRANRDYSALIGLANALRADARQREAELLLREAIARAPDWPFATSRLACLLAAQHRYPEADALFQQIGARFPGRETVVRLAPAFIQALDAAAAPDDDADASATPSPDDADVMILTSCDAAYFERFGAAFARSIWRHAGVRAVIQVHIVNPDDACAAVMRGLLAEAGAGRIAFSTERTDPAAFGGEPRTYYACSRFLRLADAIARSRIPILVLDIDMIVLRDLSTFLASLRNADLALVGGEDKGFEIWNTYWADVVHVAPTEAGRHFAALVRRYIRHFLDRGQGRWFLDQIALYAVLMQGFGDRPAPATVLLPTDIHYNRVAVSDAGDGPPPHCLFWSIHASGAAAERTLGTTLFRQFAG